MTTKQRGDTIIEVMMAMAVIGIVLGAAFGIANRSVAIGRNAQERAEALKLAESQLELLKVAYQQNNPSTVRTSGSAFCLSTGAAGIVSNAESSTTCSEAGIARLFRIEIQRNEQSPAPASLNSRFEIRVFWQPLGTNSTAPASLILTYRPGVL